MSGAPWYAAEGLRFRCTQCGDCCTGEPGYVWVNAEEIAALAAHEGMSARAFEAEHTRKVGNRRSLFERFDGDCEFFVPETRRCRVYAARPVQCRTWPFWPQNLATEEAWADTCAVCPGSGKGDVQDLAAIDERLVALRKARA
jgi:uncharacterized protein